MVVSLNGDTSLTKAHKKVHTCPKCKGTANERVHRGFFVKTFLFWLPIRKYSCFKCNHKFYELH